MASNLALGDGNGSFDAYVKDARKNAVYFASIGSVAGFSNPIQITPDGRYVLFSSDDASLVAGDTNNQSDIFVRDLTSNTTTRVSVGAGNAQSTDGSYGASISSNGRYVAFSSDGSGLTT
jgi:Tol biopolymer transport system component